MLWINYHWSSLFCKGCVCKLLGAVREYRVGLLPLSPSRQSKRETKPTPTQFSLFEVDDECCSRFANKHTKTVGLKCFVASAGAYGCKATSSRITLFLVNWEYRELGISWNTVCLCYFLFAEKQVFLFLSDWPLRDKKNHLLLYAHTL